MKEGRAGGLGERWVEREGMKGGKRVREGGDIERRGGGMSGCRKEECMIMCRRDGHV
jgi:hypothetical protein